MSNGWSGGQYTLLRAATGLSLALQLARCARHAPPIAALELAVLLAGCAAALAFALGAWSRSLAPVLAVAWWLSCAGEGPLARVTVLGALAVHALLPAAPYGSLAARGRVDPSGAWTFPRPLFALAWALFAAAQLASGVAHLADAAWVGALPLRGAWWPALGALELAVCALSIARATRPFAWGLGVLVLVPALAVHGHGAAFGLLLVAGLAFDPAWIRARADDRVATVFFDGTCGLCHAFVRFVLAEDARGRFRFAPLASAAFERAWPPDVRARLPDSVVVASGEPGAAPLARSQAALFVLARLGGLWRALAAVLALVPRPLRDLGYDAIARVRKRLFAEPEAACPLVPARLAERFDLERERA